jgi:hypothetical protein
MRADWEDFGETLFLDAMKRQLNSVHWPYFGPCVLDGDKRVAVQLLQLQVLLLLTVPSMAMMC